MLAIIQEKIGVPDNVVTCHNIPVPPIRKGCLLINMLKAAINPSDINMLEGRYYDQPELPSIMGKEGVGVVVECHTTVDHVHVGDHVIFPFTEKRDWQGVWCETIVVESRDVYVIPKKITITQAAMMTVNAPTAWYLLNKFSVLKKGDWVIQNLAHSHVGMLVGYLADYLGINMVHLVRSNQSKIDLEKRGFQHVFLDEKGVNQAVKDTIKNPIILGLNGVGGDSAVEIAKALGDDGVHVTYGAMSKKPVYVSNGQLIYKNISFRGCNRTRWMRELPKDEAERILDMIVRFYMDKQIQLSVAAEYSLKDIRLAIQHAMSEDRQGKVLLTISS